MSSNAKEPVYWLAPIAILLGIIVFMFAVPLSVIESNSTFTSDEIAGNNYLMGGGLHLANHKDDFGEIEEPELNSIVSSDGSGCKVDLPGFGDELGLYINDYSKLEDKNCLEVERPLTTSLRVKNTDGDYHLFYGIGVSSLAPNLGLGDQY